MVKLTPRRRWRGPALGGRLQRGCRFCFAAHDGEVTTSRLAEWLRPEIVYRRQAVPLADALASPSSVMNWRRLMSDMGLPPAEE
jgi:hypothetical protein